MLTNFLFMGVLASGSVFCAVKYSKRFEEIFPVTCMGFGFLLFLFGIFGFLKLGFYTILVIAATFYLFAAIELFVKKSFRKISLQLFTPGFFFLMITVGVLSLALYNQVAYKWDEFSHWMDIVKVMTIFDTFGTNPEANSTFQSYPPAMSLFQYLFQKIYLLLDPKSIFNEWRAYLGYQIYVLAVTLPMFKNLEHRDWLKTFLLSVMIILIPLNFFRNFYCSVYIDPFLAILAGAGFSAVMVYKREEKDLFYSIYIWLVIVTLVLTKDVGFLFALFLTVLYCIDSWIGRTSSLKKLKRTVFFQILFSVFAVLLPKVLWKWHLSLSRAHISFETKIDGKILWSLLTGKDETYRSQVVENYIGAFFDNNFLIGHTSVSIGYFTLMVLMCLILVALFYYLYSKNYIGRSEGIVYGVISIIQLWTFIIGMCIIYVFNFSEYEALNLAGLRRYLGIVFLCTAFIISMNVFFVVQKLEKHHEKIVGVVLLSCVLLTSPVNEVIRVVNRSNYKVAFEEKKKYETLISNIMSACDGNDHIYLIAQEDSGYEMWITRYNVRPNLVSGAWSIGEPFYEGDIWTVKKTAEEWRKELVESYDYVALSWINDFFIENYAVLFEESEDIVVDGVYQVNKKSGLLHRVR